MVKEVQNWLETKYPDKNASEIRLHEKNGGTTEEVTGELLIKDYPKVEVIDFERWGKKAKDKITKVTIENCPQLKKIKFNNNEITEVIFKGTFPNLYWLDLPGNKLVKVDVSKFFILTRLNVTRNPNLTEIEGWENLTKLEFFDSYDTPGFNGKRIKGWKDAINSTLGSSSQEDGSLPDNWKEKLEELKSRPTQEDLTKAVKNAEDKYKDYINPNNSADKAKLEQVAKNAGFIDPKDLESEAKKKGMVSKEEYAKVVGERNARPNIPLNDWSNDYSKRPKQGVLDEIQNKIKGLLGINPTTPLPNNWMDQLAKRTDLDAAKKEIESLKSKLATGGSGTGTTLTPIQQKKIEYFGVMASYLYERQGNWKEFIDNWKKENDQYVGRTQAVIEQPLNK